MPATSAGAASGALPVRLPLEQICQRGRRGLKPRNLGEGVWAKGVGAKGIVRQEAAAAGLGGRRVTIGAVEEGAAAETGRGRGRSPRRRDLHPPRWFLLVAARQGVVGETHSVHLQQRQQPQTNKRTTRVETCL